jgi:ATP-dependent RNA helicase DeaD
LVVVPTRELAVQVRQELTWLFAETGLRIASFSGGTELRGDVRTLHRGVGLAVGTPGRIVDLLERKSLDLSEVRVVVLDEADEMLDLGFREALTTILEKAPHERRTLLFSATLPREIRALAARYQKEPQSVDPRSSPAAAHEDIRHVAHLVAHGGRFAAIVNVLLQANEERSIVFCSTRERVANLQKELGARGFRATAISGERAQAERTRAIEDLRSGAASVLVATNVAARGLDLPDIGLVVHADLPDGPDALTHRSGRTGRAGKKGTSVLIVEAGARRHAERLLAAAHLKCRFTPAPSAESVARADHERLFRELVTEAAIEADAATTELAARLTASAEPARVVAALLRRTLATRPTGLPVAEVSLTPAPVPRLPAAAATGKPRPTFVTRGAVLFQVNIGRKHNADPKWLLPLICKRGHVTRKEVGFIKVEHDHTVFEIAGDAASEFAANAGERDPRAPNVRISLATGAAPPAITHQTPTHATSRHASKHQPTKHQPSKHQPSKHQQTSQHPTPQHPASHSSPKHSPSSHRPSTAPSPIHGQPNDRPSKHRHRTPER